MSTTSIRSTAQGGPQPYVTIGTQNWQRANLNIDKFRNGDIILQITDNTAWRTATTAAWCWFNNDRTLGGIWGRLYNWYAVTDPRGLAPEGWHVPSRSEFTTLSTFLGGDSVAGGKLKQTGIIPTYPYYGTGPSWRSPNASATNSVYFTGLGSGYRDAFNIVGAGLFRSPNTDAYYWTTTAFDATQVYARNLYYNSAQFSEYYSNVFKATGCSVRCIKD